ncbi:hypothetical protein [Asticcacaulis excentricus]|uniref:Uncharacterized protein n=1 Tax=Asticcacaulis excentricus (strain ATCC 15261 / DSM 4724 / KCTC 12464 / NCIMB 9791 / VKM B-1370 / CB 48) TaxID=573065 RepID=E8RV03_ASTEC|nr:hypothetical protein [Asticcacaulis excentricus]ADU14203.1 hypothetical protein Astex_2553 [Asticcacaulis excentricus CB 48]
MTHRIVPAATKVLSLLPIVQTLTGRAPSAKLMAAAGLINTPYARRVAPGLSGLISVGLAVVAVVGFVKNIQHRKTTRISGRRR